MLKLTHAPRPDFLDPGAWQGWARLAGGPSRRRGRERVGKVESVCFWLLSEYVS